MPSFPLNVHICSVSKNADVEEVIEIPEVMFNGGRLRQRHFYDGILLALTRQPIQRVDSAVTQGVSSSFKIFVSMFVSLIFLCLISFWCSVESIFVPWFESIWLGLSCH